MLKRLILVIIVGCSTFWAYSQKVDDSTRLEIKPHYAKESMAVVQLLDAYHYRKVPFSDSLSHVILTNYINALDNSRLYFFEDDVEIFHKYFGEKLDDLTRQGDVQPAFTIYQVFEKRFLERMQHVKEELLDYEYDFTIDEYYEADRDDEEWATTKEDLNDIWRKMVKSQYLSLKIAGKEEKEIVKSIRERYERLEKSVLQYRSEDVFQLYMNEVSMAYDPHTNYFSPTTSERFRQNMSLSLEGIGARLVSENDYTKIVEVVPGGPAYKSKKLEANDRIVGVAQGKEDAEMVDVIGWRLDDVVKLIKGPKGTWVTLEILPAATGLEGPSVKISLQREKIKLADQAASKEVIPVTREGHDYQIGVITIPSFYMDFEAYQRGDKNYNSTSRDVKKFLKELKAENVNGIVIDLRDNGGGSLLEAIELTGLFIDEGPVVQIRDSNNKVEVGDDKDKDIVWDGPLTVLINRFSASASEIFSAAIQDYHRGLVVGEQSYGKGTVQTMVDLKRFIPKEEAEMGQLKLTLQKFYRINGSSTQHKGVTPDLELPSAYDAMTFGESSEASALPWDQIKSARYKEKKDVDNQLLSQISKSYQNRLENDKYLQELEDEMKQLKSSIYDTKISLNEEVRRKEQKQNEDKISERERLNTSIDLEGKPTENSIPTDDKYLREAIIVLSELLATRMG